MEGVGGGDLCGGFVGGDGDGGDGRGRGVVVGLGWRRMGSGMRRSVLENKEEKFTKARGQKTY